MMKASTISRAIGLLVILFFAGNVAAQLQRHEQIGRPLATYVPLSISKRPDSTYIAPLLIYPNREWGFLVTDRNGHATGGYVTNLLSSTQGPLCAGVTSDGNVVFAGRRHYNTVDYTIVTCFDRLGNSLWTWLYPQTIVHSLHAYSVTALDSGAVIVSGYESSTFRPWLAKFSANGQIAWAYAYAGANYAALHVVPATGGGFYTAGYYGTPNSNLKVTRFDANGQPLWSKSASGSQGTNSADFFRMPDGRLGIVNSQSSSTMPTTLTLMDSLANVLSIQRLNGVGTNDFHAVANDSLIFVLQQSGSPSVQNRIVTFNNAGAPVGVTNVAIAGTSLPGDKSAVCLSPTGMVAAMEYAGEAHLIFTDSIGNYACADTHFVPTATVLTGSMAAVAPLTPVPEYLPPTADTFPQAFALFNYSNTICNWCPDPVPIAGFGYTVTGLSVQFQNQSSNYDGVRWDFGNGMTSTQVNPTVTYADEGPRTVCLSAISGCWTDTMCLSLPPLQDVEALRALAPAYTMGANTIGIEFRNNTSSSITALNLSYSTNGSSPITEPWVGNLLPGDSTIYYFSTPFYPAAPMEIVLDVWAKLMVPTLGNLPANDTAQHVACMPMVGSYDVGGGAGHLRTFADAARQLADCGQSGPVTLHIFGYHYGFVPSGYTAQGINPTGAYPVVVTYGNAPLQDTLSLFNIDLCKRMSFVGISIEAALGGAQACDGGIFTRCEDIVLDSCRVSGSAIAFRGTKNFTVSNSSFFSFQGIGTPDQSFPLPNAIENSGTANIYGNEFNVQRAAICIDGDQRNIDFVIDGNRAQDSWWGMQIFSDKNLKSMVVSNNQFYDHLQSAIEIGEYCVGCSSSGGIKIFNNMLSVRDSVDLLYALKVRDMAPMELIHNAILGHTVLNGSPSAYYLRNNIFGSLNYPCLYVLPSNAADMDYNCFYLGRPNSEITWGAATIADLQLYYPGNANSFIADPGFLSPTDFHASNATISDKGVPLASPLTDIDGDAYSNPPDVGADENGLVGLSAETAAHTMVVWPNVFHDRFSIRWPQEEATEAHALELLSADGRLVATRNVIETQCEWEIPGLAAGVYFLRIHSTARAVRQLVLVKQ